MDGESIRQVLLKSWTNNQRDSITGLLFFDGNSFLQCLEGNQDSLNETYKRITLDRRHHNIKLISVGEVRQRFFADWDMAYTDMRQLNHSDFRKLIVAGQLQLSRLTADSAWEFIGYLYEHIYQKQDLISLGLSQIGLKD